MGNDYVEASLFSSLMSTFNATNNNLKFKRLKRNAANLGKAKLKHYQKILEWLGQHDSASSCLKQILNFVKSDSHELIVKVVNENTAEYLCLKPSLAEQFFAQIIKSAETKANNEQDLNEMITYGGNQLNVEFVKKMRAARLPRFGLDVLIHRRVIFVSQIEVVDWPSSYLSSMHFRQVFYSILINKCEKVDADQPISIKEYLRYKNEIRIYDVSLRDHGSYDTTLFNPNFILTKLFKFEDELSSALCSNPVLNSKLKYMFATMHYWLKWSDHSNMQFKELYRVKNKNCQRAFIVSLIKSSMVDVCYSKFKTTSKQAASSDDNCIKCMEVEPDWENLLSALNFEENLNNLILDTHANNEYIKELKSKLQTFCPSLSMSHYQVKNTNVNKLNRLFNLKLIHCLSEFQAICLSLSYVQEVLEAFEPNSHALDSMDMNLFFNAVFIHNFVEELEHRVNPDLFVHELFGRKSLLKHLYTKLMDSFDALFGDTSALKIADIDLDFVEPEAHTLIATRRQKKKSNKK